MIICLNASGQGPSVATIAITEKDGLDREREYVQLSLQAAAPEGKKRLTALMAIEKTGAKIPIQLITSAYFKQQQTIVMELIFPLSIAAHQTRTFDIVPAAGSELPQTDLRFDGEGTELIVDNQYYRADLTRSEKSHEQQHFSGQIREMTLKMGLDQPLVNDENRVHWAPNFKRPELEYYTTIAHWDNPKININHGAYMIRTIRRDAAPRHPEILLTAVYKFYAGVPYFRFYSEMEFVQDLWLELLRNEEMTTDSMFTHLAFLRPDGELVNRPLYDLSQPGMKPIESDAPWLCFYHAEKGFALGSIRLRYDNTNTSGEPSTTWQPHTQIGEWEGKKYWNRRLIHDRLTHVAKGSRYTEENAYLLFIIGQEDRFKEIKFWAKRLRHPVEVIVAPMASP